MSVEKVREYLSRWNKNDIIEMDVSTATVELAAAALGVIPARIAKSISLRSTDKVSDAEKAGNEIIMVVTAGDMKLDNKKFRAQFSIKPRMLNPEEVFEYTGHAIGGVCPFALPPTVKVYLDISMKRFQTVFPASGSGNSCVEVTMPELEEFSNSIGWVDVCEARTAGISQPA